MSTKIASLYAEITANTTGLEQGLNRAKGELTNLSNSTRMSARDMVSALGTVAAIAGGIAVAYNATAGAAVRYADEVRSLTMVTHQSATETSRIIQVTDDYKISTSALNMAQKTLAKEGMSLSIDTLANLSDAYQRLSDGQERTQFLTQNFGRSWQDFAEIMQAGGDTIRANAANVDSGLIFNEADLESMREYQRQLDELSDSWAAFKMQIGKDVVPVVTEALQDINENHHRWFTRVTDEERQMMVEGRRRAEEERDGLIHNSDAWDAYGERLTAAAVAWQQAQQAASTANDTIFGSMEIPADYANNLFSIASTYQDIATQRQEIQDQIDQALEQGYSPNGQKVKELQDALDALDDAAERAGNQVMLSFLQMQAAADGVITPEEIQMMMDFAENTGLVNEDALNSANNILMMQAAIDQLDPTRPVVIERAMEWLHHHSGETLTYEIIMNALLSITRQGAMAPGTGGGATVGGDYQLAEGGSFSGNTWAIVGDDASGRGTGHEELIHARGGLDVYPYSSYMTQTALANAGVPRFATGTNIPKLPGTSGGLKSAKKDLGYVGDYKKDSDYGLLSDGGAKSGVPAIDMAATEAASVAASATAAPAQAITQAAADIAASGSRTAVATQTQTAVMAAGDANQLAALRDIRAEIARLNVTLPKAMRDNVQQIIGG